jgi:hypothetical protein
MDGAFAVVALRRLHEKILFEFDGAWLVGERLSRQESAVALVQNWICGVEPTHKDGRARNT